MRLLSTGNAAEDDAKILTSLGMKVSELSSYLGVIWHTVSGEGIAEVNPGLQVLPSVALILAVWVSLRFWWRAFFA